MTRTRLFHALRLLALSVFVILPMFTAMLEAQTGASLSGTVVDPRGDVMGNTAVDIKELASGVERHTTTDGQGRYTISGLAAGKYTVRVSASGFALSRTDVTLAADQSLTVPVTLALAAAADEVTVETANAGSIAAQYAPLDTPLDTRSARTEVSNMFITNFTSPLADFSEIVQMVPGAFSVNSNGIGLGDSKTYFRGFQDGLYDITFDGIPFEDTNSPTHHSWAFFPSQWIGGVDFDRSPGSASTIGPTPFGGSINLLSRETPTDQNVRFGVSYGSFNTLLYDAHYDSGNFGGLSRKSNVFVDIHHLTSDGYQTFNFQTRNAGSLKYQYKFSEKSVLTGFAGVVWLDSNTPNIKGPTRAQVAQFGPTFLLQNTDSTQQNYYRYNYYHVPTDFEYVGYRTDLSKTWHLDTKPYTYSYYNQQNYATQPKGNLPINPVNCNPPGKIRPCAIDKLNSYRKYGEITTLSQVSKFGVARVGMWYEWATTSRHQIPQDPISLADDVLPNFNEQFYTSSYQPFAEYEYHATHKLTLTGGFKYAYYNQNLKQYADNGKTIGNLGGLPFVVHSGGYSSYLPSADANYRLRTNWSVYGQFSTGSIVPPSSVFDVTGAVVSVLPKPTTAKTYQGGSVVKLKHVTFDADVYYTHFQNSYVGSPDPNISTATQYSTSGDLVSKGFEAETNVYLARGLSFYANGTAGTGRYVSRTVNGVNNPNYNLWEANTPANTESLGLTYQQKYLDLGIFNKRIGPMWNDGTASFGTANQVIPIDPFNVTNAFFNFTVRNGSHFDQTKLRFSVNNLFDQHSVTSVTQAATSTAYIPGPGDSLGLLPGRSFTLSVTFGYTPKR
jgi:iron complex outermembrane recepter protein